MNAMEGKRDAAIIALRFREMALTCQSGRPGMADPRNLGLVVQFPHRKIIFRTVRVEPFCRSSSSSTKSALHRGRAAYICMTGVRTCWWNVGALLYMDHLLTTYSRSKRDSSWMYTGKGGQGRMSRAWRPAGRWRLESRRRPVFPRFTDNGIRTLHYEFTEFGLRHRGNPRAPLSWQSFRISKHALALSPAILFSFLFILPLPARLPPLGPLT